MSDNRTKRKKAGSRLKKRYSAHWVFAICPGRNKWELLLKVQGSRQAYETVKSPYETFDMDDLIQHAQERCEYPPIISPNFTRKIQ